MSDGAEVRRPTGRFADLARQAETLGGALLRYPSGGYVIAWRQRCGIQGRQLGSGWTVASRGTGFGTGRTPEEAMQGAAFDGGVDPVVYRTLRDAAAAMSERGTP
jgi:hypothetical protein